jgi:hypothetical protein
MNGEYKPLITEHKPFAGHCRRNRGEHKHLLPSYIEFTISAQLWRCAVADVVKPLRQSGYHHIHRTERTPLLDNMMP